jgi:glycosyltransferase involved in cell wall biosynthesis
VSGNAVNVNFISNIKPLNAEKVYDGVFVGRIAKEKGVFDLLNIWKRIVEKKNDAKLLIVGSGIEFQAVKEAIFKLGLENKVFLRGRCRDRELYELLKLSRVFIFPSLFEGWGIAVAEALACGLPVVAYDIPALREVFGECKGVFLVPVKNIVCMGSIVLEILNLNEDEWGRLSHYSRVYSESFSWEKVAEKDLEALKSLF